MTNKKIAIAGAGITGLTAAWVLQKKGCEVTVFEKKDQPGGSIKSVESDGWLAEYGPNTFQLKSQKILNFFDDLNLTGQLIEADSKASKRFVVNNGELVEVPSGALDFFRSSLFSMKGKLRLLREPFVGKSNDSMESLSSFVERRLGRDVLDNAVDPFVAGIYAGTPENLSVRLAFPKIYNLEQQYGSLITGAVRKGIHNRKNKKFKTKLISFDKGLQVLPNRISSQIKNIRFNTEVSRVEQGSNGIKLIAGGVRYDNFDHVLLNMPLYKFSDQLIEGGDTLFDSLNSAPYPPLSVILTGYERKQVQHPLDGFGFLVPLNESRKILGSLFNSSLFPNRAPAGYVMITTFVGGMRQPVLAAKDSEELKDIVQSEHSELLGITGTPKFFDHIFWPNSIPQYTTEYDRVLKSIDMVEKKNPGVYLIGNFRGGISMPDCIENGLKIEGKLV
jgi:protoporphyrinogen/coproporphyrinogen III oxidase